MLSIAHTLAQLSDTLLSILAVRGGEMVKSIFPEGNEDSIGDSKSL